MVYGNDNFVDFNEGILNGLVESGTINNDSYKVGMDLTTGQVQVVDTATGQVTHSSTVGPKANLEAVAGFSSIAGTVTSFNGSIPANSLAKVGDMAIMTCAVSTAANANAKSVNVVVDGVTYTTPAAFGAGPGVQKLFIVARIIRISNVDARLIITVMTDYATTGGLMDTVITAVGGLDFTASIAAGFQLTGVAPADLVQNYASSVIQLKN